MSITENCDIVFDHKWMAELAVKTELECMSILYAKSLLHHSEEALPQQNYGPQRIYVAISDGQNDLNFEKPPAKPQRFIARMTSAEKKYVMTANNYADQTGLPNSYNQDCRYRSTVSLSSTKDEECSTNDLEVATLTALSSSVTQSTQTEDGFFHLQEDSNTKRRIHPQSEKPDKRMQNSLPSFASLFTKTSCSDALTTSTVAVHINNYDSLPIINHEQKDPHASNRHERTSSLRSSQRYSAVGQANLNQNRERKTMSTHTSNCGFAEPQWKMVCAECGKRSNSQMSQMTQSTLYESNLTLQDAPSSPYCSTMPILTKQNVKSDTLLMSQSWNGCSSTSNSILGNVTVDSGWRSRASPPPYSQLRIVQRGNCMTSQVMVNMSPQSERKTIKPLKMRPEVIRQRYPPYEPSTSATYSTKSTDSLSNSSVDSGQGSGELSSHGHSSKEPLNGSFDVIDQRNLPSYARMANAMDQILRMSTSLYTLLNLPADRNTSRDLLSKTNIIIHIIEASPSAHFLPTEYLGKLKQIMKELQVESDRTGRPVIVTTYFSTALLKILKGVLLLFTKVISQYLLECTNKDRLLVIASEHLIHIMLFGEEMRLEAIRYGALKAVYSFCQLQTTPCDTLRLLLRALAVMCNASKGSQQLISLGGLDLITRILCTSSVPCGVEAAGVLTQLTNPNRGLIKLTSSIDNIVARLLDVIDACASGESLLLCVAATANISIQSHNVVSILYQHNAVKRLIAALNRPKCSTVFVQEQMVTIFSRMATRGYEEVLIAQGAIPVLFSMLAIFDSVFMDYSRRIQYKAAVCLGTVSSKGIGLKAIYQNNGYAVISKVLQMESIGNTPIERICLTIKEKLEAKYEIESVV